ncbi:MAG: hypothetical protein ABSG63_11895 [Spirochaetia bacterium]|jgi:hypothetical protein
MKGAIIAAGIFVACCAAVFGQAPIVTLQNQETSPFYYVIDPEALAGLSAGSPQLATRVADFFAASEGTPAFVSLAPDGQVRIEGLANGPHLLVGYFAIEGQGQFPVRVITLQADSRIGERFYAVYADPALISVARGAGRLSGIAPLAGQGAVASAETAKPATDGAAAAGQEGSAGGAAAATEGTAATAAGTAEVSQAAPAVEGNDGLQSIATFSMSYDPVVFTRESKGTFTVLPISGSRAWTQTGTRVTGLSGAMENGTLRVSLTVAGGFSQNVSYFFYVFANRAEKENRIALELRPRAVGSRGACLLWQKGGEPPRIVGSVTSTDSSVELDVDARQLPADLAAPGAEVPTVDLTAGWFERASGTWEEFYYTTFSLADIPVIR